MVELAYRDEPFFSERFVVYSDRDLPSEKRAPRCGLVASSCSSSSLWILLVSTGGGAGAAISVVSIRRGFFRNDAEG